MSTYLSRLYANAPLQEIWAGAKDAVELLPGPLRDGAKRAKDMLKHMTVGGTLFEELGFDYVGPIDGHDMGQLLPVLRTLKARADKPVLLHVITRKGKGYSPAEARADRGHATAKFDVVTGEQAKAKPNAPAYTKVFANALIDEATRDDRIVAVTAAMPDGTGLNLFAERFPQRCFDVGIAEQHGVTFAPGWRRGACGRSRRSTRRSCNAPTIRSSTTSRSSGCRCGSRSTAPGSSARTVRPMPAPSTWRTWRTCLGSR